MGSFGIILPTQRDSVGPQASCNEMVQILCIIGFPCGPGEKFQKEGGILFLEETWADKVNTPRGKLVICRKIKLRSGLKKKNTDTPSSVCNKNR